MPSQGVILYLSLEVEGREQPGRSDSRLFVDSLVGACKIAALLRSPESWRSTSPGIWIVPALRLSLL